MAIHKSIKEKANTTFDICIIGSGPAGMTLASELSSSNKKICVVESGGISKNQSVDKLKEVVSTGDVKIRESSRERIFGGTSTTWSGLSSPLDDIDLHTWPITKSEIYEYYRRSEKYGFTNLNEFSDAGISEARKNADFTLQSKNIKEKIFIAKDPAWNFAKELKHIFEKDNVDIFLNSTVVDIKKNGNDIQEISIKSEGDTYSIKSKIFIIAAGGIESTRILLTSNIGNENDLVGRYITNHPKNNYGVIRLNKPVKDLTYLFGYLHSGWARSAGISLTEEMQKSLGILNSYVRLEPVFPWTDSVGVTEVIAISKKLKYILDYWKRMQKKIVGLRDWNETGDTRKKDIKFNWFTAIYKIIIDAPKVISYGYHRIFQNKVIPIKSIRLRNFMEMEARYENRIILDDKTDINGNRIPKVILNFSELDKRSVIELHRILGEEIRNRGIGILESDIDKVEVWPINSEASHHLGGAIMGLDRTKSVVDQNLKVHSTNNLYICSGSVFPTSGCANPTYTICALAIRLADHLKKTL